VTGKPQVHPDQWIALKMNEKGKIKEGGC